MFQMNFPFCHIAADVCFVFPLSFPLPALLALLPSMEGAADCKSPSAAEIPMPMADDMPGPLKQDWPADVAGVLNSGISPASDIEALPNVAQNF